MTDETQITTTIEEASTVVNTPVAEAVEAVVPAAAIAADTVEIAKVALDAFTNKTVLATRASVLLNEVKTLITHLEVETQTDFAKAVEQLKKYL